MKEESQDIEAFRRRFDEAQEVVMRTRQETTEKLSDENARRAHELREEAWDLAISRKHYDPDRAICLITEAAELDSEYEPQIQLIRNWIDRRARKGKVDLKKAITGILQPFLLERGYVLTNPVTGETFEKWNQDTWFCKDDASILVSRTKFGNELCVLVCRTRGGTVEYFPWRNVVESDLLAYLNQEELNEALRRLVVCLETQVLPWIAEGKTS